jgi:DNA-binding response OmpR family regulator
MSLVDNLLISLGLKAHPQQEQTPLPQVKKKVAIIEDDSTLAGALETKFTHENFAVFKAANGQDGLTVIQENKPDVILLDLMMPVMDGKTMLRNLRSMEEFKALPVVILTNAGDVDNMRETKEYGNASEFLIKSNVNPDDIVATVKRFML